LSVEVPAAEQGVLFVAEENPAVGEVGMGTLVLNRLLRISVEGQTDPIVPGQAQQSRQEVVVTVSGDQYVRVETLQQVAHAEYQLASPTARKAVAPLVDLYQQVALVTLIPDRSTWVLEITIQPKGHDPQGRQLVVHVPRGVERFYALDGSLVYVNRAVGERKQIALQNVPLRQGNICVVVSEVGEGAARLLKEARQVPRNHHAHFLHFNLPIQEQVDTLRHPQLHRRAFSNKRCAQVAQAIARSLDIEARAERVAQLVSPTFAVDQPHRHSVSGGIGVEKPREEGRHGYSRNAG
jgi:hypothetical protein